MKRDKIPSVSATVDPEFLDNFRVLLIDQTGNNTLKFYCPQIDANAFNYDNLILTLSDAADHYCLSR